VKEGARGNSHPYRDRRNFITLLGGAMGVCPLVTRLTFEITWPKSRRPFVRYLTNSGGSFQIALGGMPNLLFPRPGRW
jgi:hypothetical protein